MDTVLVETGEKTQEVVDVHLCTSVVRVAGLLEYLLQFGLDVDIPARRSSIGSVLEHVALLREPGLVVTLEHLRHSLCLKVGSNGLVATSKEDPGETVKLLEPHRRRWVDRYDPDDGRLDVRWRTEGVLGDFEDVVDFGKELNVGRQSVLEEEEGKGRYDASAFPPFDEDEQSGLTYSRDYPLAGPPV